MDFSLSNEQVLLSESLLRFLDDHCNFAQRRKIGCTADGWSREVWKGLAGLGVLGANISDQYGGMGVDPTTMALIMERFGGALLLEPYLSSVVLCATALQLGGTDTQRSELLPRIVAGQLLMAWAHEESRGSLEHCGIGTVARNVGSRWLLNGSKRLVLHGGTADQMIVTATTPADCGHAARMFIVKCDSTDVKIVPIKLHDGTRAATVVMQDAVAEPMSEGGAGWPLIEQILQHGMAAVAAEAVGAMDAAMKMTLSYIRTREQFGRPIGSNQALQHRAAEMYLATEQCRSMALLATMMMSETDADERRRNLSRVQIVVGCNGRFVGQQAIQLHGAMGMTEEYPVGHFHRRLEVLAKLFGDSDYHVSRVARSMEDGRLDGPFGW